MSERADDVVAFDATPYLRAPVVDAAGAVALGGALIAAAPEHPTDGVARALARLVRTTAELRDTWRAAGDASGPVDRRPIDNTLDHAWRLLHDRLVAYAALPVDRYPRAARARELDGLLFTDGLGFLNLPFHQEWTESERRLKLIAQHRLAPDLAALAGEEFVAEVERAHAAYSDALGMTRDHALTDTVSLVDPLRAQQQALAAYLMQVVAMASLDRDANARARRALAPVDELRRPRP